MAKTTKESKLFEGFTPPKTIKETKVEKKVSNPVVVEEPTEELPIEKEQIEIKKEQPQADVKKEVIEPYTPTQTNTVKTWGRPKKYEGNLKNLKVYLPEENYNFIKMNGWEHDGMNGFINYLIEKEMKSRGFSK